MFLQWVLLWYTSRGAALESLGTRQHLARGSMMQGDLQGMYAPWGEHYLQEYRLSTLKWSRILSIRSDDLHGVP